MSKRLIAALTLSVVCGSLLVAAQQPPAGQKFTIASSIVGRGYKNTQRNLTEAAEKMPETDYSFKPTPQMRPFSQLVAHVALAQFGTCSALKGQTDPHEKDKETSYTSKSEALGLLKASTAMCDDAFANLTDENMHDLVKAGNNEVARGLFVTSTNSHGQEMYGTMAVYLRLKGITPPSTERAEAEKKAAEAKAAAEKKPGGQ
jgi:uncharacterized damage-inducible protein DinB